MVRLAISLPWTVNAWLGLVGLGRVLYRTEGLGGAADLNWENQQPLAVLVSFPGAPETSGLGQWIPLPSILRPALRWSQPQLKQELPSCLVSYLQGFLLNPHPQSPGLGQLPDPCRASQDSLTAY